MLRCLHIATTSTAKRTADENTNMPATAGEVSAAEAFYVQRGETAASAENLAREEETWADYEGDHVRGDRS